MAKPNFIFIVSDSLRGDCVSYAGHPDVQTPFLQEASERGHVFCNHHAQAPVCGPSRNSFWTGRYPHSNGSHNNLVSFGEHQRTFVDLLGEDGYDCVSFGSNHLQPEPAGFRMLVSSRNKHPRSSYRRYRADTGLNGVPGEIDQSTAGSSPPCGLLREEMDLLPDAYATTRAVEHLQDRPESPFFLYLGLHLPHPPYAADRRHFEMYDNTRINIADYQDSGIQLHPKLQEVYDAANYGALTEDNVRIITAHYLAMATFVDEQVGRVLTTLRDTGLDGNTHVVFTSDHGDFCGDMGMFVKTDLPIRHLTHVPLLWVTPEGTDDRVESFSENVDLAPTFLQAAGIECPYYLEGKNLFDGGHRDWAIAESSDRESIDGSQRYQKTTSYTSYVDREWNYIHSTKADHCALYHLTQDPHCHRNVLHSFPEKAAELRTKLLDHMLSDRIPHQDNSLASWEEYHGGAGIDESSWE